MTTRQEEAKRLIDEAMKANVGLSLNRFAAALLKEFKGEEGVAHEFGDTYFHADPGSNTRRALLEGVMKLLILVGQEQAELDKVSREDMEAELLAIMKERDERQSGNGKPGQESGG